MLVPGYAYSDTSGTCRQKPPVLPHLLPLSAPATEKPDWYAGAGQMPETPPPPCDQALPSPDADEISRVPPTPVANGCEAGSSVSSRVSFGFSGLQSLDPESPLATKNETPDAAASSSSSDSD